VGAVNTGMAFYKYRNGHYDCAGVRAATRKQDLGLLENWLRLIRDVYRLHKDHYILIFSFS